jgi:hypothetical protein
MLEFDESTHTYTWNGSVVPSVTQLLSRVGVKRDDESHWNSISGSEFMHGCEVQAEFGTHFHMVAELYIRKILGEYDPAMEPWVKGLEKFMEVHSNLGTVLLEEPIYSKRYGYAGTLDWLSVDSQSETYYLIDWKTSVAFSPTWYMQTAAYEQLVRESLGIKKKIIRMPVRVFEFDYFAYPRRNNPEDWNKFLSVLNVYKMAA